MENNDVIELLDILYGMVTEAWGVPLGNDKCIIEREKALKSNARPPSYPAERMCFCESGIPVCPGKGNHFRAGPEQHLARL